MVISQGDIYWAALDEPSGSEAGFRRPVVVIQGDSLNRSGLNTCVCVPLTSNLLWAEAPGNVLLTRKATGLPRDSVAQTALILSLDRAYLHERAGRLRRQDVDLIFAGLDVVLGR